MAEREYEMEKAKFTSKLTEAAMRALSAWLFYAFKFEIRTPKDLVDHFGIKTLITSLSPEVRGEVFSICTGADPKIAAQIDAESVAVMVASMLRSKQVDEEKICKPIPSDHMVEVLDSIWLFGLVFGDQERRPWLEGGLAASQARKRFMAAVHDVIHDERLLEPDEYVSVLETKLVHDGTPPHLLVAAVAKATELHREGKPFSGEHFIKIYTPEEVVGYVDLPDLFLAVEAVAKRQGWIDDLRPIDNLVKGAPNETVITEGAPPGLPLEALDSYPPDAPEAPGEEENRDPEITVGAPASVPPEAELDEDVSDGEFEELELPDDDSESAGVRRAASPPPLGGKDKKKRRGAVTS
jgi:hypothetical protein